MRFTNENYLKAFPRENKPARQAIQQGNVIEEAEAGKITVKEDQGPGDVLEGAPDPDPEEGADNGNAGHSEPDSQ